MKFCHTQISASAPSTAPTNPAISPMIVSRAFSTNPPINAPATPMAMVEKNTGFDLHQPRCEKIPLPHQ